MFGLLLTLLILDGVLLTVVVLLQAGKGGGLAAMGGGGGGTDSFMGGRQATTVLTKTTWATGAVFLFLAVVLSILSSRSQESAPLLQQEFRQGAPATAPQPILPGAGDAGAGEEGAVPGLDAGAAGEDAPATDD